jgi:hypothetical protein
MYCNQCHNARTLAERPFANYQNVAAHMRVRANLTGKEYEKLLTFMRRWHDVPSPESDPETTPKRITFSQPIAELRDQPAGAQPADAQPEPAQAADSNPVQPPQAFVPAQPQPPAMAGPG